MTADRFVAEAHALVMYEAGVAIRDSNAALSHAHVACRNARRLLAAVST